MLASIPSPPWNVIEIGPLDLHVYGITMALAVATGAVVTIRRYERFGGDPRVAEQVMTWAVIIGFLGARAAYVTTHTARYEGEWWKVIALWEGGLALYGGITFGALAAIYMLHRRDGKLWAFGDAIALGLPIAQIIGRIGNYFNQELFGTPTDLPWGVEIDPGHRPSEYLDAETFHPTFLYEMLWNLLIVIPMLVLIERRRWLIRGNLFPAYVALYSTGRFLTELLRTDTTFRLGGLSRNGWVSLLAAIASVVFIVIRERRAAAREGSPEPAGT